MSKFEIGQWVTFRYVDETLTGKIMAVQLEPEKMCNIEVKGEMYYEAFEDLTPAIMVQLAPAATEPRAEVAGADAVADGGSTGYERYVAEQEYWKRIETDYRETVGRLHGIVEKHKLPAPPGEEGDKTIEREIDALQARNAALEAELARVREALEPFAEAWVEMTFDPTSEIVIESLDGSSRYTLGIRAAALQDAHTAFFKLADSK